MSPLYVLLLHCVIWILCMGLISIGVISGLAFFTSWFLNVLFEGWMLPKQFDISFRIHSNRFCWCLIIGLTLSVRLLQQHSLASLPEILSLRPFTGDWPSLRGAAIMPMLYFTDMLTVLSHRGGDLLQCFFFFKCSECLNFSCYTACQAVLEGDGTPSCSSLPRIAWGGHRSTYWEQHLSGEAFTVEDTEGAPCRLLWLLISDVASYRLLPLSRGRAPGAQEHRCFSKAAVLLMSPQTEWTTPICSKYISLSS